MIRDHRGRPRGAALALAAVLVASACSAGGGTFLDARGAAAPSGSPSASGGCPTSYAAPDPRRPRIGLTFELAEDLRTVRGTEQVTFTPDLPVRELVFRLTPNTAPSVAEGNRVEVTAATATPAGGAYTFERAGAAATTQGGLLRIPLGREVPAGQEVTARVEFTLTLGKEAFDRFGHLDRYAWWGTGQPLLAWERGVGWHTEPLLQYTAESATSEAADTEITVTAPGTYEVLMSGTQGDPVDAGGGRRTWRSTADRARDVSVAVGPFQLKRTTVEGTTVVVGTPPGTPPDLMLTEAARGVRELVRRFGPSPYPVINLARLPLNGGGIEYPGSILMLDDSRGVIVHELAHQWFYGMVGNSQARDPWLDEAFATWAEETVDGTASEAALQIPGDVGDPTAAYGGDEHRYYTTVYGKGAAALVAASKAAGEAEFLAAIRCYVNANAWRVARPSDLAAQLKGLPEATKVLTDAGALP
jgi:hypothetical protein